MSNRALIHSAVWLTFATTAGLAQCTFPAGGSGRLLSYIVDPKVSTTDTILQVILRFQGGPGVQDDVEVPVEWAGERLHGIVNLRALSPETTILDARSEGAKMVRHSPGQDVVLAYDIVKDWTGPFRHPAEFHGALLPDFIEVTGDNALVHPRLRAETTVTVHFEWKNLPAAWVLATSFGTGSQAGDKCQAYSGAWGDVERALFAAGDFRVSRFRIGREPAILAIRGQWTFTDEELIAAVQKAVGAVRDFWGDHNFPYYLVTLKPFDNDSGSGDGSAFTNAFWLYLSRRDSISDRTPILVHETFHEWDPRRMGPVPPEDWSRTEWFREGFVSYYSYLLAARVGLIDLPAYLDSVNRVLRIFPTSTDAYVRGRVVAFWLDQRIRKESSGKSSLQNVMRDMVREASSPLTQQRILKTAGRYLGRASRAELAEVLELRSRTPPLEAAFVPCARGSLDEVATFDLGFDLATSRAEGAVTGVEPDGPAFRAGLRNGQGLAGRVSVHKNEPEKLVIVTIGTNDGPRTIEYYPRSAATTVTQYHLDEQAYRDRPDTCAVK
jgi:predicted metalloprotease with PDZ domain